MGIVCNGALLSSLLCFVFSRSEKHGIQPSRIAIPESKAYAQGGLAQAAPSTKRTPNTQKTSFPEMILEIGDSGVTVYD